MTVIVLVRHASTAWTGRRFCGRSDPPLDAEAWPRWRPSRRLWPGGERHLDLERRIARAWSRTLVEAATVPMVVVAHAGSIRVAAGLAGSQVDGLAPGEVVRLEPDSGTDARS